MDDMAEKEGTETSRNYSVTFPELPRFLAMLIPVIALRPRVSNAFFRPTVQPVTLQPPFAPGFRSLQKRHRIGAENALVVSGLANFR